MTSQRACASIRIIEMVSSTVNPTAADCPVWRPCKPISLSRFCQKGYSRNVEVLWEFSLFVFIYICMQAPSPRQCGSCRRIREPYMLETMISRMYEMYMHPHPCEERSAVDSEKHRDCGPIRAGLLSFRRQDEPCPEHSTTEIANRISRTDVFCSGLFIIGLQAMQFLGRVVRRLSSSRRICNHGMYDNPKEIEFMDSIGSARGLNAA